MHVSLPAEKSGDAHTKFVPSLGVACPKGEEAGRRGTQEVSRLDDHDITPEVRGDTCMYMSMHVHVHSLIQ